MKDFKFGPELYEEINRRSEIIYNIFYKFMSRGSWVNFEDVYIDDIDERGINLKHIEWYSGEADTSIMPISWDMLNMSEDELIQYKKELEEKERRKEEEKKKEEKERRKEEEKKKEEKEYQKYLKLKEKYDLKL